MKKLMSIGWRIGGDKPGEGVVVMLWPILAVAAGFLLLLAYDYFLA